MGTFPATAFSLQGPPFFVGRENEIATLTQIREGPGPERAVAIIGPPGIGKTALADYFSRKAADSVQWMNLNYLKANDVGAHFVAFEARSQEVVIADGLDAPEPTCRDFLARLEAERGDAMVIVTSRSRRPEMRNIELGPLSGHAVASLWKASLAALDTDSTDVATLIERVGGQPLLASLLGQLFRSNVVTVRMAARNLRSFVASGIVGPDGRPIDAERRGKVEADVRSVGSDVLSRLRTNPQLLYEFSSRQFEELVADLLHSLGYETHLTPATRDGGKDIYAARKDALGRFLYIVECKRHAPDNPVGVGVVRSLAGVVNAERANGGIVATTSFFTRDAREFQQQLSYQLTLQDYFGIQELIRVAARK